MTVELRPWTTPGIALVGAALVAVTPIAPVAAPARAHTESSAVALAANDLVGLIVGGTGTPIPELNDDYVPDADRLYIQRILPGADSHGIFTPEGGSPIYTGIKSLPFDQSFAQDTEIMKLDIMREVEAGNTVAVFGESQSSTASGMVMPLLEEAGVPADAVKFVLVGDPSNPAGGLLERFNLFGDGSATIPSLQITFSGATPSDTIYETDIYTQEYDGFADFPKYTSNFLADLNAVLGLQLVHPTYRSLTEGQLGNAIHLDTSDGYDGVTDYYLIPHDTLPLADFIRTIPLVGKPVGDLLEPALRLLVNLGYDNSDPMQGWDSTPADVPSPFDGGGPSADQVSAAMDLMPQALKDGWDAFLADLTNPSEALDASSAEAASFTDIVNGLTSAFSNLYALLLPGADIFTALAVTLPTYDLQLLFDNIADPVHAFELINAANTGLTTVAAGIGVMVLEQTFGQISEDLPF